MSELQSFNQRVIDEFRAGHDRVGGVFPHDRLLLLHTTGARTGEPRVHPLVFRREGDAWVVFGSKGGAPTHPDWYRNVVANPDVEVEIGGERIPARARVATGEERERIWNTQKAEIAQFGEYEQRAGGRQIPVVILERVDR